jgi:cytochrome c-type biogenesis protein CcmH
LSPNLFLLLVLVPLGLLVTGYVLWPMFVRSRDPAAPQPDSARELNKAIVRERRAELERELAGLPPDSADRERLIMEFSSSALADLAPVDDKPSRASGRHLLAAAVIAGILVAGPLAFYRIAGMPDAADPEFRAAASGDMRGMVAELERRLQANPDAADGWLLLGRSKMALGDLAGAVAALEKALKVDSTTPELAAQIRVDLADAIAQGSPTRLEGRPWELIQDALRRDPGHQKALALAGAYRVTQDDAAGALRYWEALLAQLAPGSSQHEQIGGFVADLKAGRRPGTGTPQPPTETAAGPVLRGTVALAPGLAGRAATGETVFVVARSLGADGEPEGPPVAVMRATVADLPLQFTLSDRDAMSPAARLSGQSRVVVVARVSKSGTAGRASGDLEGRSHPVAPDATGVQVSIGSVVP